jgi:site-specific recombinase XerD
LDLIAHLLTQGGCDSLTLDWSKLRYHHTAAVRAVLIEQFAPSTVNQMLCALRRVLKEAKKLKLMLPMDYTDAVDIESVRVSQDLRGRALSQTEIAAIMRVIRADVTSAGRRDAAMLAILLGSGLRRSEVVSLDLSDFDPNTGAITVRGAKGGKDRTVYLPSSGIRVVDAWLNVRGVKPGPLLYPISKSHRVMQRRLTDQAVLYILQNGRKKLGEIPSLLTIAAGHLFQIC